MLHTVPKAIRSFPAFTPLFFHKSVKPRTCRVSEVLVVVDVYKELHGGSARNWCIRGATIGNSSRISEPASVRTVRIGKALLLHDKG